MNLVLTCFGPLILLAKTKLLLTETDLTEQKKTTEQTEIGQIKSTMKTLTILLLPKQNKSQLQNNNFFCSGIINLLFDGLAYNTSGHFARIFPRKILRNWKLEQLGKMLTLYT